jgi:hypothetical protein
MFYILEYLQITEISTTLKQIGGVGDSKHKITDMSNFTEGTRNISAFASIHTSCLTQLPPKYFAQKWGKGTR